MKGQAPLLISYISNSDKPNAPDIKITIHDEQHIYLNPKAHYTVSGIVVLIFTDEQNMNYESTKYWVLHDKASCALICLSEQVRNVEKHNN